MQDLLISNQLGNQSVNNKRFIDDVEFIYKEIREQFVLSHEFAVDA